MIMAKRNIGAVAQSFLGVPAKADTTPKTEEPKKVVPVEKPKAEPKPIEKKTVEKPVVKPVVVEEPVVVEAVPEPEVKGPKLKNGKRQFNLIMPTELYDQLQTAAAEDDRSLNSFIVLALKKFIAQNG